MSSLLKSLLAELSVVAMVYRRSTVCLPHVLPARAPRSAEAVAPAATSGGASTAPEAAFFVRRARGAPAAASARLRAEAHWSGAICAWHVVSLLGRGDMSRVPSVMSLCP